MVNGNVLERGKRDKPGHWRAKGWLVPNLHPWGASPPWGCCWKGSGAPGVSVIPGESQHRPPGPTSLPVWLLPHGCGLETAGTERCTQIGVEGLGVRVLLRASWCHPWLCTGASRRGLGVSGAGG